MEKPTKLETIKSVKGRLKALIQVLPITSGCYLFKDKDNNLLYVGKSKNIRTRVRSYFNPKSELSPRILLMVMQIYDIEVIITDNESEALTLESNLIKTKQPYFNILLKDDKKYPYLCVTWSDEYPRIFITRKRRSRDPNDKYYGPFVDVALLRTTLALVKKHFPVRQRPIPLYKDRTCLNYDIGMCPGVCQKLITSEKYKETLTNIAMIFQGRPQALTHNLNDLMILYSTNQEYEKAGIVRDQIKALDRLGESQKMTLPDSSISRDVINLFLEDGLCSVQIFQMRAGRLVGRLGYFYDSINIDKDMIIEKVIEEHYITLDSVEIPPEILIPFESPRIDYLCSFISKLKNKKIKFLNPKRKDKAELIALVERNAEIELRRVKQGQERNVLEIEDLAQIFQLSTLPKRIEGYDISHIQGSNAVGSQVVFIQGIPAKQHYRRYSIKDESITIGHSDDYLALSEVIERRFKRWSEYKRNGLDIQKISKKQFGTLDPINYSDWPDLVMIDGGKGQLNAVMKTLKKMGLDNELNICSLAKKQEKIFVPGYNHPLDTDKDQLGLLLLRRLRDEAHRFALSFHRKKRNVAMKRSYLIEIPGVGPKRIKSLLTHFNSIQAIQLASIEDISQVEGIGNETAIDIWKYFHP